MSARIAYIKSIGTPTQVPENRHGKTRESPDGQL